MLLLRSPLAVLQGSGRELASLATALPSAAAEAEKGIQTETGEAFPLGRGRSGGDHRGPPHAAVRTIHGVSDDVSSVVKSLPPKPTVLPEGFTVQNGLVERAEEKYNDAAKASDTESDPDNGAASRSEDEARKKPESSRAYYPADSAAGIALINEVRSKGYKITEADVIGIVRDPTNRIVWLETAILTHAPAEGHILSINTKRILLQREFRRMNWMILS